MASPSSQTQVIAVVDTIPPVITATDACGNTSGAVTIGRIHVPHDESDAERCVDADREGCKDPEPPPCGKGGM